eukprot:3260719-Prymnesium_polylepis.1
MLTMRQPSFSKSPRKRAARWKSETRTCHIMMGTRDIRVSICQIRMDTWRRVGGAAVEASAHP